MKNNKKITNIIFIILIIIGSILILIAPMRANMLYELGYYHHDQDSMIFGFILSRIIFGFVLMVTGIVGLFLESMKHKV